MTRHSVTHHHAWLEIVIRRKLLLLMCSQFLVFILIVCHLLTCQPPYNCNRGTTNPTCMSTHCIQDKAKNPSCLGGKCSQKESTSPTCTGGQCNQDNSVGGASCVGSQCSQVNVKGIASCSWGCTQNGDVNPTCTGGGCCRDTLDTNSDTCPGGYMQTGENSCGPNAKGCSLHLPIAEVSVEESRFLRA